MPLNDVMTQNGIAISVIVPVYNAEACLRKCVSMIQSQSLPMIEIILADDCSCDSSLEMMRSWAEQDSRILVLRTDQNSGSGVARNLGLQHAHGKYIAFMDADDYYPDAFVLEDLYFEAERHLTDLCGGYFLLYNCAEGILRIDDETYCNALGVNVAASSVSPYAYQRYLFRRDFLVKNQCVFSKYRRYQDPVFLSNVLRAAPSIFLIQRATYVYCVAGKDENYLLPKALDHLAGKRETVKNAEEYASKAVFCCVANDILRTSQLFTLHICMSRKIRKECSGLFRFMLSSDKLSPPLRSQIQRAVNFPGCFLIYKWICFKIKNYGAKLYVKGIRHWIRKPFERELRMIQQTQIRMLLMQENSNCIARRLSNTRPRQIENK